MRSSPPSPGSLVEAGVPLLVAGTPGTGRATLRDAVATFLPADSTRTVLRGDDEDFEWLPEAVELGWHRDRPARPARARGSSSGLTVMVADLRRPARRHLAASGRGSRSGRSSLGYGMLATVRGDRLEDVFERLGGPPVDGVRGRAVAPRAGPRRSATTGAGSRRPTTSGRSPATSTATSSGCAPAVLATWDEAKRRFEHFAWGIGDELADRVGLTPLELRARAGPARRDAGDGGVRAPRLTPRARGATLAARAETADPGACRGSLDHRSRLAAPRTPRHPRRAARLGLAAADGQGGAAGQPRRAAVRRHADLPGHRRLRRYGHPGDRERDPRRPGHRVPRRARTGEDPPRPPAGGPARRVAAGRPRRRAERRPVRARSAPPPARSSPRAATTRRSTGCRATGGTRRSSRRPTSRSPTSSARWTRSASPRAATCPTS